MPRGATVEASPELQELTSPYTTSAIAFPNIAWDRRWSHKLLGLASNLPYVMPADPRDGNTHQTRDQADEYGIVH